MPTRIEFPNPFNPSRQDRKRILKQCFRHFAGRTGESAKDICRQNRKKLKKHLPAGESRKDAETVFSVGRKEKL